MKEVLKIKQKDSLYGWDVDQSEISCKCVMAIALERSLDNNDLADLEVDSVISIGEYRAIKHFDGNYGTETDLTIIKQLASKYNITIEIRKLTEVVE